MYKIDATEEYLMSSTDFQQRSKYLFAMSIYVI